MAPKNSYRLITVMAVFAILLIGCGGGSGADKLVGKWEYTEPTSGMSVTLDITKDTLSFSAAGFSAGEASYTYVDSDTLKIKDPDSGQEQEISYSLSGDKLTIDMEGEKIEFTKVK